AARYRPRHPRGDRPRAARTGTAAELGRRPGRGRGGGHRLRVVRERDDGAHRESEGAARLRMGAGEAPGSDGAAQLLRPSAYRSPGPAAPRATAWMVLPTVARGNGGCRGEGRGSAPETVRQQPFRLGLGPAAARGVPSPDGPAQGAGADLQPR